MPSTFADLRLGDHVCHPFISDDERLAATVEIAADALRRGRRVMVCAESLTPQVTSAWLHARVPGYAEAAERGQVEVLPCAEVQLAGGTFDPARVREAFAGVVADTTARGYPGLQVITDMAWALRQPYALDALPAFEASINDLFADGRLSAVCQYDRRLYDGDLFHRVCSAHPVTPGQALLRFARATGSPGLVLEGEADVTNRDALAALLASLLPSDGHVLIDATGLEFADVGSARLFARFAAQRGDRPTTLLGSQSLTHLLRLLGAHDLVRLQPAEDRRAAFRVRPLRDPPGLRLEGDVDDSTAPVLSRALTDAATREPGDVHADLSGVRFISLGGIRALVSAAQGLGGDRALVLGPVPGHVRELIEITGWSTTPGLRLPGPPPSGPL
ncbi:MEDS domain-containing protein [Bailinhaonella thermotolerans]|uniref:MEDS domain-containing protein n=1 Tax=Bailinhaonella thermotolerans TaxID=1070861 RepID=UPI00192A4B74|nr:MEDS domain-containing protein [Bailinhaonella thermotolerans]